MKRKTIIKTVAGVAALAILVLASGYFLNSRHPILPAVYVITPTRGAAVEAVFATGTVEPVLSTKVSTAASGRVLELFADEGIKVIQGEMLGRLDARSLKARIRELEARALLNKQEADRSLRLFKSGNISIHARDQAVSSRDSAQGALESAKAKLEDFILRAPISGTVLRRDGEVGILIQPGQVVFIIGALDQMRISASVDEEDILLVKEGQKALIRNDALKNRTLEGKVVEITPMGDPVARNYRVRIGLAKDTPLLAGMTVEVNIIVQEKNNALLVPNAVIDDGAIWQVSEGRAKKQKVKKGIEGKKLTEILEGVNDKTLLIVKKPARLRPGQKVRTRK